MPGTATPPCARAPSARSDCLPGPSAHCSSLRRCAGAPVSSWSPASRARGALRRRRHNDSLMQVSSVRYRQVAYAALVVCTLIVFTGAGVRLTGSGLGCPDWPRCDGSRLTPELHIHGLIEFGNRVMTSVVAIPCLAAAILAFFRTPFRRDIALLALL